jgi:hypothetical protein
MLHEYSTVWEKNAEKSTVREIFSFCGGCRGERERERERERELWEPNKMK